MLQAFTRNYKDDSTDAGFQFTFYCDICKDGYKSSFVESTTYKKKGLMRGFGQGANILGGFVGGRMRNASYSAQRTSDVMSEQFSDKSPEWRKEHEKAFQHCQNGSKQHFHRCPNCNKYVCNNCWNKDEGLCVSCAPRQEVYVAQARADVMKRNIDEAKGSATVWNGKIESKTTICPSCGKFAGSGKFCNDCGASLDLKECHNCGAKNALTVRFCNNCGTNLTQTATSSGKCSACGEQNTADTKFCGGCGNKLDNK